MLLGTRWRPPLAGGSRGWGLGDRASSHQGSYAQGGLAQGAAVKREDAEKLAKVSWGGWWRQAPLGYGT